MFCCCDVVVKGHLFKLSSTTQKCRSSADGKLLTGPREMTYDTDICWVQHSHMLSATQCVVELFTCKSHVYTTQHSTTGIFATLYKMYVQHNTITVQWVTLYWMYVQSNTI